MKRMILLVTFTLLLMIGGSARDLEVLVLNNLGKTVSKVNVTAHTIDRDWVVVDDTPDNTSPNDMLIYDGKLYVVISMTTPSVRVFHLTSGALMDSYDFDAYSNPYAIARVADKLYISLAGFDQIVVLNAGDVSAGPEAAIAASGWPQGVTYIAPYVYAVSTGSWGTTTGYVFVIDPETNTKIDSIATGRRNPTKIAEGNEGGLAVLCAGVWGGQGGAIEFYSTQTWNIQDSLLFDGYLDDMAFNNNRVYVSGWGSFTVFEQTTHDELFSNIPGGKGFYFTGNGNVFTAKFDVDSIYGYDADMNRIEGYLAGDGPQCIIEYNTEPNNIADGIQCISEMTLSQNYPNPFNPVTMISFQLSVNSPVELAVYNAIGQKIATLVSEMKTAGAHQVEWNAGNSASGIYYCQLKSHGEILTRKMMLIK